MTVLVRRLWAAIASKGRQFEGDLRGQIALIFGLAIPAIIVGVGASIDISRAYIVRQKLSQVAELTCQFSVRPSVVDISNSTSGGSGGFSSYLLAVNTFAINALSGQNLGQTSATDRSNGSNYFTATAANGTSTSTTGTAPSNPVVEFKANVPTLFMQLVKVPQIAVHAKIACLTAATTPLINVVRAPGNGTNYVLQEGFETACSAYCFTRPNGTAGTSQLTTSTTPSTPSYISNSGQPWYIIGYCLETDIVGIINATAPEGSHTGELDCDNGSGSAGNSSITAKVYLAPGIYELRYNYRGRVDYPNYDPTFICGSTAADVSWANDTTTNTGTAALRTNQINVYLDMATTPQIPLHATIDGTQQLGGSNLIDVCVYTPTWIERSVKIDVSTPAYYWLSFAADGAGDSYGGQLDNIRVCQQVCTTPLQDDFPTPWLASNNGGLNKILFEDTFESPVYAQDPFTSSKHSKGGNLSQSYGVAATAGCTSSPPGWPCQTATGWAVAPYNEVVYWEKGATQGSQYISLQGWNGFSNSSDPINRSISRGFILDPGYYNISYYYTSLTDFSYDFVYGGYYPVCAASPTSGFSYTNYGIKQGYGYGDPVTVYAQYLSTDFMNVFLSSGQLVSTPVINSTLGGAPTYNNPNGTSTSSPTVPLDNGSNYASYNASAVNPVIDACYYSYGYAWATRSINVKITKPGQYWLTFSAQGNPLTALGAGPGIDDVKLTALGSYTMTTPPTATSPMAAANATPVAIPVPAPQPDTVYYGPSSVYNGFTIIADPFMPPSAH